MSRTLNRSRNSDISIPLQVPVGTLSGQLLYVGNLLVYTETDRASTPLKVSAPGLKDGEATCVLVGIGSSVRVPVAGTGVVGDKVYILTADGTYTTVAGSNKQMGILLEALTATGLTVEVGLAKN